MANIAIYIADTSPSGITRYAFNMAMSLNEFGHQCTIISDTNSFEINKTNLIVLSEKNRLGALEIPERVKRLKQEIDVLNIHVVISNGWYHDMVSLIASKLSLGKPPVIGVVHTRPELWGLENKWYTKIKSSIIRRIYSAEDITISVSESLAVSLKETGWVKHPITIYNPIVSDSMLGISKVRSRFNSTLKLACMGWISPVKGFDVAIKALVEIRKSIPATLTIIGASNNENYFSQLKEQINKHGLDNYVLFSGSVDDPFEILDQMDIFLLPSRSEALPTALIEAMAIGIPVIASDCNFGPREILQDGLYGSLVPINDWKKLAIEVEKLAENRVLYKEMSRMGILRAQTFNFTASGSSYNELIKKYKTKEVG
ncbi:MAG: glycosyltransferase [Neobacillus sp.]|jgi:glycosyltransferase involved in cell wall biosynthesis